MKSRQELFDALFKDTAPKKYAEALKKHAAIACEKTHDMREARDDAFRTYTRLSKAYNLRWGEDGQTARKKTHDMREARDAAFRTYTPLSNTYNLCWREAWETARDAMIVRGG